MFERFLNTLSYRLKFDLDEWRKYNSVLREHSWSWFQRILIAAGVRPVRSPLVLCIFVLVLSALICGYDALEKLLLTDPTPPNTVVDQHFFILWSIQSTIVALIYPIVIGFVTLLLQRRHSAKASLHIYLHDTSAILTGLSALFLVFSMSVQFFFLHMVSDSTISGWLLIDTIWFLVNILGVIWFLIRTFDYLRPERRAAIMRIYALNYIWPAEVRCNLESNLFLGAIYYGWLPGPVYGDEKSKSKTAIITGSIGRDMGDIQVTKRKKGNWTIGDVRFRLLLLVIRSWQRREDKLASSSEKKPDTLFGMRDSRLLILPSVPGEPFDPEVGLCRTKGGTGLKLWERWLIRQSFYLIPLKDNLPSLSISDLLNDFITEIQVYLQSGEEVVFTEALRELIDLHSSLIQSGDFINDFGKNDNYTNLVDRNHVFFGDRVHALWGREYRRLIDASVARLSISNVYFNHMVNVSGWLISRLEKIRPIEILCHLLNLSRYLHYRLNRWWSKTGEEQGSLKHDPCEPCTLHSPAFTIYESAIKQFIGNWESLKDIHFPPSRDEKQTWDEYGDYTKLFAEHLKGTLYMLFDSLSLGNSEGSEWLCDGLIKWWSTTRFGFDDYHYYIRDKRMLTLELIGKPWDEAKKAIDLSVVGGDEDNAPKVLWSACIYNYWTDLCCVSLYAIIQIGKYCVCEKSLPAQLIQALARGRALREGGSEIVRQWPIKTVEDLLVAIIRQYYFDGGYRQGYRLGIDNVVEGILGQGKPAMVPGRVYSGWGLEDLDALRDGQLALLCLLVKKDWLPSPKLMKTIQKWGIQDDRGLRAFVESLKQLKTRLNETEFQEYQSLYLCVKQMFNDCDDFQDAITLVGAGFDQLIKDIEGFRFEQLSDAQVSYERLSEVAQWGSRSGFNKITADVPISLFREVRHSDKKYTEHSLVLRKMNKGEFVKPEMAQRVSNEDEWFDHTVKSHVAVSVMAHVLKNLDIEIVDVDEPNLYWEHIKTAAINIRKEGGSPILFVASRADPRWLMDWIRSSYGDRVSRPEDLQFHRGNQFDCEGYMGSLNDIPVYIAPIGTGSSYLVPKETLDVILFTEFEKGVFLRVAFEPVEGKDTLINLRLSWFSRLDLEKRKCWQLRYIPKMEA